MKDILQQTELNLTVLEFSISSLRTSWYEFQNMTLYVPVLDLVAVPVRVVAPVDVEMELFVSG